jgi:hypothetical protein
MDRDQQFRELLEAAVPAETGRAEARSEIMRRVRAVRLRRRALRATGAVAAAAAGLVGVAILSDTGATTPVPVIGRQAGEVAVETACGEYAVVPSVAEYLDDWTSGSLTSGQACILEAIEGPEPTFDPGGLGDEQTWLDDDLSRGTVEPPDRLSAQGYPVVHIGTTALYGDPSLPARLLRSWSPQDADAAVWWCTSTPLGGGCGAGLEGEAGVTSADSGGLTIDLLVPADTAVAALSIDGEPVAWQRPRGRTVLFSPPMGGERFTVTAYGGSGTIINEYPGQLEPD